ncbi:TorF family putative porin [Sphingomonas quercus]|uniref:TorF family putative porin n=1 Tax=Sphingomonas quercus TaxID=2842451 RepID=A0ABS6BJC3_9SPHN|nr:TorF family putative porin [Sphingomonas quercus]MBU3077290.1 TorF family putative porin [Sphingomonas quercus]
MRYTLKIALILSAAVAAPAFAEDTAPPSGPITVTGGATVVSDYRFRGVSQTDRRFALQGTLTVTHESGFYVSTWGSSIDDYVAYGSDQEIDLIAGYHKTVNGTTFDIGGLYYYYPGSHGNNTDFIEPYASVSHVFGPATAKAGLAYAPKQRALATAFHDKEDNLYMYGELGGAIPDTGFSVLGHVGYSKGRSVLTSSLKGYVDWNLGVNYTWQHLTLGVAYADTDIKNDEFTTPSGRHPAKAGAVVSLGASF